MLVRTCAHRVCLPEVNLSREWLNPPAHCAVCHINLPHQSRSFSRPTSLFVFFIYFRFTSKLAGLCLKISLNTYVACKIKLFQIHKKYNWVSSKLFVIKSIWACVLLCKRPGCCHSVSRTQIGETESLNWPLLQWYIRFAVFTDFQGF